MSLAGLVLAALVAAGCATGGGAMVQSLHIFTVPVAVNMDGQPGPDGFSVRMYARGTKSSKGMALSSGTVEILMFDGALAEGQPLPPTPMRTWRFTGAELKNHAGKSAVGDGYRFTLRWDEARPTQGRISVAARYLPPSGAAVMAAPSSVTMSAR